MNKYKAKKIITIVFSAVLLICAGFGAAADSGLYTAELFGGMIACRTNPDISVAAPAAENAPYVIAIDPGHGGMDTGAQRLMDEVDICDKTAGYLYRMLENDENFTPMLTRDTDSFPSPKERAAAANSRGASLLISIHANSDSHSSSSGFECYALPPGRQLHSRSLKLAGLISSHMQQAGRKIRGEAEACGIKYAYYFGSDKKIVPSTDSKIRSRKTFGVLENALCPAVLVEQCFITNSSDIAAWGSDEGCRKAARAYYRAIKEYFMANN